jgi:phosphoglycolate phosphatase-like HAD superfamily hydrolase
MNIINMQSSLSALLIYSGIFFYSIHPSTSFTLLTFDVDGTLVKGSGRAASESAHARAFSHAVSTILNNQQSITPVAQALPRKLYHGSTDGLILLRLANATLGIHPRESLDLLDDMFDCMYQFMSDLEDEEVAAHITPLPGVMHHLTELSKMKEQVMCGLVTGNVEGIARKKMKAVGIWDTNVLSPPCSTQKRWEGLDEFAFLGGFGSDYCSGNIDDIDRNYLDRGEQIAIAANRCKNLLPDNGSGLKRVVHIGDAPADVLAAKWFSQAQMAVDDDDNEAKGHGTTSRICVGLVAVATGSYSADELRELAGDPIPGRWEPVILEDGMNDPAFLEACGIGQ